ncbi:MAG: spore germination protein GerW family protein [Vicinamibacterales bacterium]
MPNSAPFEPVADVIQRSLSIRHVYGEPVERGAVTVIPVAQVAFGFGAGGGRRPGRRRKADADEASRPEEQGSGGGGGVRMTPVGVLEIGPGGTRFVPCRSLTPWLIGAAVGLAAGLLMAARRR